MVKKNKYNYYILVGSLCLALTSCKSVSENNATSKLHSDFYFQSYFEQVSAIREALVSKNYTRVSEILKPCIVEEGLDIRTEVRCEKLYNNSVNQTDELVLAAYYWFESEENNYHATMLVAKNSYQSAWIRRSHNWSSAVSSYRIDEFNEMLHKAIKVAEHAYNLRPDLPYSYNLIIDSYGRTKGETYEPTRLDWIVLADEKVPNSFIITESDINVSQPRWGGSYKEMERIRNNFYKRTNNEVALEMLDNYILYIKARDLSRNNVGESDKNLIYSIYKELLEKNYKPDLINREISWLKGTIEERRYHLEKSYNVEPYDEYNLFRLADFARNVNKSYQVELYKRYLKEFPNSYSALMELSEILYELGKLKESKEAMLSALRIEPYQPEPQQFIAMLDAKLGNPPQDFDATWYREIVAYAYPRNKVYENIKSNITKDIIKLNSKTQAQELARVEKHFNIENMRKLLLLKLEQSNLSEDELKTAFYTFSEITRVNHKNKKDVKEELVKKQENGDLKILVNKVNDMFISVIAELDKLYKESFEKS